MDLEKIDDLRSFLAAHVGQTLTPEMCHTVDRIARFEPDRSIDPARFEAEQHGEYRLQVERFSAIFEELEPLHLAHYQETEKHRLGIPMCPDYERLVAMERAGRMVQFTARGQGGDIAGHVRMFLATSLHTQTLLAEEDTLYLRPEYRGTGLMVIALVRYAEQVLRSLGAREIRVDSKLVNKADVLMRRLGYQPYATKLHKYFED